MSQIGLSSDAYELRILPQPAVLSVLSFEGVESLGELYRFEVEFTSVVPGLPMASVLGRPAQFTIQPREAGALLAGLVGGAAGGTEGPTSGIWNGIITAFETLGSSNDETRYRVVLEPRLSDLQREVTSRLFQNQSVPQILESVLRRFGLTAADYRFALRADYAARDYTTQYQETTLAFVQRLAADEGIWFRFDNGAEREVIVFGDDLDAYARTGLVAAYEEDGGLESGGALAVKTLSQACLRVPQAVRIRDYNHRAAAVDLLSEVNAAQGDATTGSVEYLWGEHHAALDEGERFGTLRHQAHLARQVTFSGTGNVYAMAPGEVFGFTNHLLADAPNGLLITRVTHGAARDRAYTNYFAAIPADRIYRPTVDRAAWPNIAGVLPARVTSPGKYQYAYLSPEGWYRIILPFDLDEWTPGGTSRPVRFAKPYSGGDYGHHFPLLDGTEVAIAFTGGDPDRPIILGAMHDSGNGDLVTNLNNTRNLMRTAAQNELRMEDRRGREHVHLGSPYAASQLNLGHIANTAFALRGAGAELRSDNPVVVRSNQGVLVTAEGRPGAGGKQQDMAQTQRQLAASHEVLESLAEAAKAAKAMRAELDKHEVFLKEQLHTLEQQVVLLTGPAGVGVTSGGSLALSAGEEATLVAGGALDIAASDKITVAASKSVSLFAASDGAEVIAAQGKVRIEAQDDTMLLAAMKDLTIASTSDKIILSAPKEIWIGAGGSYIKLTPNNIEIASPGEIYAKCTTFEQSGPQHQSVAINMGGQAAFDDRFRIVLSNGEPIPNHPYVITRADGARIEGVTDADGKTQVQKSHVPESVSIEVPIPKLDRVGSKES